MCRCATSWSDLDLTFHLAIMTLTYKSCPGYISETVRKFITLVGALVRKCRCATSCYELDLTFHLAVVTLTYKIMSGLSKP